jgi:hypothetical protein
LFSPFWDKRVENLDCLCCMSILLHLVAFLYYNNPELLELDSAGAAALDNLLVAANIVCFAAICLLFTTNVVERRFNAATSDMVSQRMAKLIVAIQHDIRHHSVIFVRALRVRRNSDDQFDIFKLRDAHVGVRVADAIHGIGIITFSNEQQVDVRYDGGQVIKYDSNTASAKLSVLIDSKDQSHVSLSMFVSASQEALDGGRTVYSSEALEALFYMLLLIDKDTDLKNPYLSPQLRDHISHLTPLSMLVVSAPAIPHLSSPRRASASLLS